MLHSSRVLSYLEPETTMRFIDRVDIIVAPGNGGNGVVSFRRERFMPSGGPDGGDGGHGGSVIFRATRSRNTLQDYYSNKVYRATHGQNGSGNQKTGADGADELLLVPLGTVITDLATEDVIADLTEDGQEFVFPGGQGGLGNIHFKTSGNRSPNKAIPGQLVDEVNVRLELKLIADVGLLGFPNAGKSTFISRVSAAKPEIAGYPFTTLVPNLGVVRVDDGKSFVIADIPGLIEGAAEGRGLGLRFLRHVERCRMLLHLVSTEEWDGPVGDRFRALQTELSRYDSAMVHVPQLAVLTKTDLVDDETRERMLAELKEVCGHKPSAISAATGEGLMSVVRRTWRALEHLEQRESDD